MMKIVFLGSGTSLGVPTIGCPCSVCASTNPKNKRTRPSLLLNIGETNLVIDTSSDFRQQAIRERLHKINAVLYTHAHADHILGLDDLRPYNYFQRMHIPCYGNQTTMDYICQMFGYVFTDPQPGGSIPRIEPRIISGDFQVDGIHIQPLPVLHGKIAVNGYRIGNLSYITDCSEIPDSTYRLLEGTTVLVLGVLRYEPHPTHLNIEKALRIIDRVQPGQAYFTHLSHDFDHDRTNAELPHNVQLSYDGLNFEMEAP
jgi:phosphoribosyl 1,2-cyclic phosphate phosphodiesterase